MYPQVLLQDVLYRLSVDSSLVQAVRYHVAGVYPMQFLETLRVQKLPGSLNAAEKR